MRSMLAAAFAAALLCLAVSAPVVVAEESSLEWVQPAFVESLSAVSSDDNPASIVAWEQPRKEHIDHQDHRRVHVTLMASHLDIAQEHSALGNGVQTIAHVDAASKHNAAAVLHRKADQDPDFITPAVKASHTAYAKTRSLIRRRKPVNMRPKAQQPNAKSEAALKIIQALRPSALAPESLEERQTNRELGKA